MSEMLHAFHFLRPWWLFALIPALVLVGWLWQHRGNASAWRRHISPNLLRYLLDQQQLKQQKWPLVGVVCLWALAIIALAGPSFKKIPQPVEQTTAALVILWDLSPSMLAEDIAPSRLERARLKIIDLLKARDEGLFALVAYSGEAYNVTPLTDDIQTIINLLPALSPAYLPSVGSNPEMAFDNATQLLQDAGVSSGHIVFVTDGIAQGAFDYLARAIEKSPYQASVWAVGTPAGAPIPLPNGGFAKDSSGTMVVPKLDEQALQQFARRTDAYYVPMVTNDSDIQALTTLLAPSNNSTQMSEREFDQWLDHGQFLPLLLVPFAALMFRRGWLFVALLALPFALAPRPVLALSWNDFWLNQDQQAAARLAEGDPDAASQFKDPQRRGAALFEQQNFKDSAQAFAAADGAVADYNRGTALAHAGQFDEAIAAFDQALTKRPGFTEAAANRAIAQELKKLQQQNQQQQQGDQQQNGEQGQNGEQQEAGNQGQQQNSTDGQQGEEQGQDSANQSAADQPSDSGAGEPGNLDSDAAQPTQQAQASDNEQPGENPYAGMTPDEPSDAEAQQAAAARAQAQAEEAAQQQQEVMALTGAKEDGKSEAQQQLDMMLRKVPDDPGGLLREKFRYQYLQRKQDPTQSFTDSEAENRW